MLFTREYAYYIYYIVLLLYEYYSGSTSISDYLLCASMCILFLYYTTS